MRVLSLFLKEPRALDVFAYRGFLFVLTFDGIVLSYDVSRLTSEIRSAHGDRGLVVAYALFSSLGIGATAESKRAWNSFDHQSSVSLVMKTSAVGESKLASDASAHLDMRVYYNQLFLATSLGTFRAHLDQRGRLVEDNSTVDRLTSEPSESLSAGMGAVGASLGEQGLAVFFDVSAPADQKQSRLEVRSLRSSIGWGRAINYPTNGSYEVLSSTIVEGKSGRRTLTDVGESDSSTRSLVDSNGGIYAVWNFGRLLVADSGGVDSLGQGSSRSRRRALSANSGGSIPLWLGVTGNRFLVTESSDRLSASKGDDHATIHDGPAIAVRTFGTSQRYRRLIASTVEGGVLLSAAFSSEETY